MVWVAVGRFSGGYTVFAAAVVMSERVQWRDAGLRNSSRLLCPLLPPSLLPVPASLLPALPICAFKYCACTATPRDRQSIPFTFLASARCALRDGNKPIDRNNIL